MSSRYYNGPVSDHFDGHRFFGPDRPPAKTLRDILKWNLTSRRARWPRWVNDPPAPPPVARVEGAGIKVTMIGHACVLLQTQGLNILTDPIWSQRASPVSFMGPRRVRTPGLPLDRLPPIDLALVTHNHYDHLDMPTLKQLVRAHDPLIVTPLGNDTLIRRRIPAARTVALDWDQAHAVGGTGIEAVPVQHWSSRWLTDRNEALWAGFALTTPARKIFVTGDTGIGDGWWARRAQARHGSFDLALLPIGAYAPRWFMRDSHMNPAEAVDAFRLLHARRAVGYHHETFQLTDEAIGEPAQQLAAALAGDVTPAQFRTLAPGASWLVDG